MRKILSSLKKLANSLDEIGDYQSASELTNIMKKVAQVTGIGAGATNALTSTVPTSLTPIANPSIDIIKKGIETAVNKLFSDNKTTSKSYQDCTNIVYAYLYAKTNAKSLPDAFTPGKTVQNSGLGPDLITSPPQGFSVEDAIQILTPVITKIISEPKLMSGQSVSKSTNPFQRVFVMQLTGNFMITGQIVKNGNTKQLKPLVPNQNLFAMDFSKIVKGHLEGTFNDGQDKFVFDVGPNGVLTTKNKQFANIKDLKTLQSSLISGGLSSASPVGSNVPHNAGGLQDPTLPSAGGQGFGGGPVGGGLQAQSQKKKTNNKKYSQQSLSTNNSGIVLNSKTSFMAFNDISILAPHLSQTPVSLSTLPPLSTAKKPGVQQWNQDRNQHWNPNTPQIQNQNSVQSTGFSEPRFNGHGSRPPSGQPEFQRGRFFNRHH